MLILRFLEHSILFRNIGDYSVLAEVTTDQVREMLAWVKGFITAAENYLKQVF